MEITEWRDFETGRTDLAEWMAALMREGWVVAGDPIPMLDERGVAVLRYQVGRAF